MKRPVSFCIKSEAAVCAIYKYKSPFSDRGIFLESEIQPERDSVYTSLRGQVLHMELNVRYNLKLQRNIVG